jgi:CheY-like chemotaxis protein
MDFGRSGTPDAILAPGSEPAPILLVEDEILIRLANADWLRDAGYAVIEAANAAEALDVIATGQVLALLATDITMPGALDGLALAAATRMRRPGLPVLLLSAHVPDDYSAIAEAALSKPFGPSQLVAKVAALIGAPWQTTNPVTGAHKAC